VKLALLVRWVLKVLQGHRVQLAQKDQKVLQVKPVLLDHLVPRENRVSKEYKENLE
jgi:hypothetical protein